MGRGPANYLGHVTRCRSPGWWRRTTPRSEPRSSRTRTARRGLVPGASGLRHPADRRRCGAGDHRRRGRRRRPWHGRSALRRPVTLREFARIGRTIAPNRRLIGRPAVPRRKRARVTDDRGCTPSGRQWAWATEFHSAAASRHRDGHQRRGRPDQGEQRPSAGCGPGRHHDQADHRKNGQADGSDAAPGGQSPGHAAIEAANRDRPLVPRRRGVGALRSACGSTPFRVVAQRCRRAPWRCSTAALSTLSAVGAVGPWRGAVVSDMFVGHRHRR